MINASLHEGRIMGTRTSTVMAVAIICAAWGVIPLSDAAARPPTPTAAQVAAEVVDVSGANDVIPAGRTRHDADSASITTMRGGGTVDVPKDPTDGITVTVPGGPAFGIGIAGAETSRDAATNVSGTTVFGNPAAHTASAVQATTDGVRQVFVLNDAAAPTTFAVPLDLPAGTSIVDNEEGGFSIVSIAVGGTATVVATVEKPWAKDATGRGLPTRYTLSGNTLIQIVDTHGAVFPVVADPKFTWGWVSGTIYFNRSETSRMRNPAAVLAMAWGVAALLVGPAGPYAVAFATWMTATHGAVAAVAANAYGDGGCLKIKIYGPVFVPQTYKGGYCK